MTRSHRVLAAALFGVGLSASMASAAPITGYTQTNLVSDLTGVAELTDPSLKNPWGVSESATSPLWVSDQVTRLATLYTITMGTNVTKNALVVSIPTTAAGPQGPTGQVRNNTKSFVVNGSPAAFIFANLNGTISAWNPSLGSNAQFQPTTAIAGAMYTGLATGMVGSTPFLYTASGGATPGIKVFDGTFANVTGTTFAGKFVDPNLPSGYVPFNVQNIGGEIYVAYAPATNGADRTPQTMAVAGQGFVDIYDTSGNLVKRLISGSQLAAPWGMALAPATGFGPFSGDLLVDNFAYGGVSPAGGEINAYNPTTGDFIATLDSNTAWQGLWALIFGNGGNGGAPDILYFTTGLRAEADGLLAAVSPVAAIPEPGHIGPPWRRNFQPVCAALSTLSTRNTRS
jgi:uncharacterized protein (TIGR03118 family)